MKLLILKEEPTSHYSFFRGLDCHDIISLYNPKQIGWNDLIKYDCIKFINPCTDTELAIIRLSKDLGKTVVIDWSLDPFSIPEYHSYFKYMASPINVDITKEILNIVDKVYVSNQQIFDRLQIFTKGNCEIKGNKIPPFLESEQTISDNKLIVFRGIEGFVQNTISFFEEIKTVKNLFPDWIFLFIGNIDSKYLDVGHSVKEMGVLSYLKFLRKNKPSIMVSTMELDEYSRTRNSDLFVEAMYCGSVCIAPDIPSWENIPALLYSNKDGFVDGLKALISSYDLRKELYKKGKEWNYK